MKRLSYILLSGLMLILSACEKDTESANFAPVVTTGTASNIYRMGATLSGSITLTETNTAQSYGILLSSFESMAEATEYPVKDGSSNYNVLVQGLESGETYYYCAYASSGYSTAKSQIKSFTTTNSNAPVFNEVVLQSKDEKSCAVSTELLDDGGSELLMTGFVWGEAGSGDPTIKSNVVNVEPQGSRLSATIKGMEPNKSYLVRAYGVNAQGVGYSNSISVTTNTATVPVLSDIIASDSTEVSITVKSTIVDAGLGEVTEYGFCYSSESKNPTTDHLVVENIEGNSKDFSALIDGLKPETTYYIRAYAINEKGTGYSEVFVYTTKAPTEPGIYSLEDLVAFRDAVNSGADISQWLVNSSFVNLYADIDATSIDWTPINELPNAYCFEGNGHTISLKKTIVRYEEYEKWGLFYRNNGGFIQNLNVDLDMPMETSFSGGSKPVVDYTAICIFNGGNIVNCHVSIKNYADNYGVHFGGIVCTNLDTGLISQCSIKGTAVVRATVGGIAQINQGYISDCHSDLLIDVHDGGDALAGIAAYNIDAGKIDYCVNYGSISVTSASSFYGVGGIVGRLFSGTVDNCQNKGNIEIPNSNAVGGIVGNASETHANYPNNTTRIVTNCANTGAIVGPDGVTGNIIGVLDGADSEMTGCTYGGTVNGAAGTEANAIGNDMRVVTPTNPGIYTLDDLLAFRDAVNNDADFSQWVDESNVINLYADIDASSVYNSPTGDWERIYRLNAGYTFEGNNFTITFADDEVYEDNSGWALFYFNMGTVQNLNVVANLKIAANGQSVTKNYSAICSHNYGVVHNCHATISVDSDYTALEVGGIAFSNHEGATISQCSSQGSIEGISTFGGVVADNLGGTVKNCSSSVNALEGPADFGATWGGIAWRNIYSGSIVDCVNEGNLNVSSASGYSTVGGIVCYMANGTVDNCVNHGDINVYNTVAVGGIVADASGVNPNDPDNTTRIVSNCTNTGDITASSEAIGNMIGIFEGDASEMTGCTYGGTVNGAAGTEANAIGKDLRTTSNDANINDIPTEEW